MRQISKTALTGIICVIIAIAAKAQLADDKCKFLGNIHAGTAPADFKTYWNQVTPENAGKWGSVESTRDVMTWTALDNAYKFAKDNGFPFKQHTLVWGQQQPAWISTLPAEEQKAEVEAWIKSFCERYPDTDYIDVVNEPLHAIPSYAGALGASGETGWDWIVWSFEKAREYCPNAKLILNDYSILSSDVNTDKYIEIINVLKERELIDIIGEQGHFFETTPIGTIKNNLDKLHALELPIHISEFDINLADDNAQLTKYKELFPVLWKHPGVHGVTLWGYRQGQIWREDAYLIRINNTPRPALGWLTEFVKSDRGGTFCNPVTGARSEERKQQVYPNPVTDGRLVLNLQEGEYSVRIRDLQGVVRTALEMQGGPPLALTLAAPAGVYFVEIHDGTSASYTKIVVN